MHKIAYEVSQKCDTLDQFMEFMLHHPFWMDVSGKKIPDARKDWIIQYWQAVNRSVPEIIEISGFSLAAFAREFYIPKRSVEDWKSGARKCALYTKLLLQESLGIFQRKPPREAYTGILKDAELAEALKNM